jgi:hypothetical protein
MSRRLNNNPIIVRLRLIGKAIWKPYTAYLIKAESVGMVCIILGLMCGELRSFVIIILLINWQFASIIT